MLILESCLHVMKSQLQAPTMYRMVKYNLIELSSVYELCLICDGLAAKGIFELNPSLYK